MRRKILWIMALALFVYPHVVAIGGYLNAVWTIDDPLTPTGGVLHAGGVSCTLGMSGNGADSDNSPCFQAKDLNAPTGADGIAQLRNYATGTSDQVAWQTGAANTGLKNCIRGIASIVYAQAARPSLTFSPISMCAWKDTDDSNRIWLVTYDYFDGERYMTLELQ